VLLRNYQSHIIDDFDRPVARTVRSVPVTAARDSGNAVITLTPVAPPIEAGQRILAPPELHERGMRPIAPGCRFALTSQ